MIVRATVVLAVALVVAGLALDMSGRAPRTAGSNRVAPVQFVANVPPGGKLCQAAPAVPDDAARALLTIGTYGHPLPAGQLRFTSPSGALVAEGALPSGGREGVISVPLSHVRGAPAASQFCLQVAGRTRVALAGSSVVPGPGSVQVNDRPQGGLISLGYVRSGRESWWSLLPALTQRFGRGKAAVFGDWTLPACVLLLVGVWAAALRLLAREPT